MNIYWVNVNNDQTYEDYYEEIYLIAAQSEEEARQIGVNIFDINWWKGYGVNSSAILKNETDNGFKIKLV